MKYKKQEKVPCCQCHLAYYIFSPTSHTTCNAVYVNEMIMLDLKKKQDQTSLNFIVV